MGVSPWDRARDNTTTSYGGTDVIQKSRNSCEEVFRASSVDCMNGAWMDHFAVSGNILAMETKMMAADVVTNEVKGALSVLAESQNELGVAASQLPPLPPTLQICHLSSTIYDCFIMQQQNIYLFTHATILAQYSIAPTLWLILNQTK